MTEPLLFNTFPYLTIPNLTFLEPLYIFAEEKSFSAQSFDAPYKFSGAVALSVDNAITFSTLLLIAASIIL